MKVTIPISSTGGKVLAVPTAAVSAAIDGMTRVEVEDSPGAATRLVLVTAGLRAEGFVQITPTKPAQATENSSKEYPEQMTSRVPGLPMQRLRE